MAIALGSTVVAAITQRAMGPAPKLRGRVVVAADPAYTVLWENGNTSATTIPGNQLDVIGVAAAADLAFRDRVVRITTNTDASQESRGLVLDVYTRTPTNGDGVAATFASVALLPDKQTVVEVPIAQVSLITDR